VCASAFLEADWKLNGKQRVCDWLLNGVFSPGGLIGANLGAASTYATNPEADRGDTYLVRIGRRAGQNAFKTTGAFVGALIAREDPRRHPPYLSLRPPRPTGLIGRTGRALSENLLAYRCTDPCEHRDDVRRRVSVARTLGAAANGFGGEVLIPDRSFSASRALRASATAYAVGYANAVVGEFTPELTKGAARLAGLIFRGR
jgi:hypothetical protein